MNSWEKEQFFKAEKYQTKLQDAQKPDAAMQANKEERESLENEAKKLLSGEKPWRPTWQALGLSYDRGLTGNMKGKGIFPGSS
jgi:large subunit ribosomal protein L23